MSGGGHGGGGHGGGGGGAERWLITYADVITLLMVFFIVLYATANTDRAKYAAYANALRQAVGGGNQIIPMPGQSDGVSVPMPGDVSLPPVVPPPAPQASPDELTGIGQQLLADFQRDGRFTVHVNERGLVISLAGSAAFDSGKADIRPEFRPLLDAIAERLKGVGNDISVEGFTDSDPIKTADFPSNWHLSTARAHQVREYLQSKGVAEGRMIVVGYGEVRPLFSNETPEGKAKNRRVDIIVLNDRHEVELGQEIKTDKK